jgi:hypothetical protein
MGQNRAKMGHNQGIFKPPSLVVRAPLSTLTSYQDQPIWVPFMQEIDGPHQANAIPCLLNLFPPTTSSIGIGLGNSPLQSAPYILNYVEVPRLGGVTLHYIHPKVLQCNLGSLVRMLPCMIHDEAIASFPPSFYG